MKKTFAAFGLLSLTTFFISGCLIFEDPDKEKSMPSDMSVAEISERMEKASDPNDCYRKSKSYILKQEMKTTAGGKEVTYIVEVKFKLPNFLRTTTLLNNKPIFAVLFDGTHAWNIDVPTGKSAPVKGKGLELVKTFSAIGHPANTLTSVFPEIEVSEVKDGTKEYYKLVCQAKYKDIDPYIMYVGKNNFLTKKLVTTMYARGTTYKYVSLIDRYSIYKGVMMASESTVFVNNDKQLFHTIDFQLNVDIPDSDFELPVPWYNQKYNSPLKGAEKK